MQIERLDRSDLRKLKSVAEVYRKTFATDPWREVSRGFVCGNFYGPENPPGTICPCGCGKLEEAYPVVKTTKYIRDEISKPNSVAKVVMENGKPVGFGWAYEETGEDFANLKYKPESREMVANLIGKKQKVIYLSEFGLVEEERKKGKGMVITKQVVEESLKFQKPFLMRTNRGSTMRFIAEKLGMKPIMGSENTPPDPENPDRILYYKE